MGFYIGFVLWFSYSRCFFVFWWFSLRFPSFLGFYIFLIVPCFSMFLNRFVPCLSICCCDYLFYYFVSCFKFLWFFQVSRCFFLSFVLKILLLMVFQGVSGL